MKKIILFASIGMLFMASCKKDRTCTCVTTNSATGSASSTEVYKFDKARKSDARARCLSTTHVESDNSTTTMTCTLK